MRKIKIHYFLFIFSFSLIYVQAQDKFKTSEEESISGGAEFIIQMHKNVNTGYSRKIYSQLQPGKKVPSGIAASGIFEGINYDENYTYSDYYMIPPDPIGAAGLSNLVSTVNSVIQWFTKDGILQHTQRLGMNRTSSTGSFFESLDPVDVPFDPKVIYDQYNNRFVVAALESTENPETSRILLAVSQSQNPNDGWYYYAINSKITIDTTDYWADYPGLAVGPDAIFLTANLFPFPATNSSSSRLWIISKNPFYSGGTPVSYVYDPASEVNQVSVTMQPAQLFGVPPDNILTFLVRYSGYSNGKDEALSIIKVSGTVSSPVFSHQFVMVSNIDSTSIAVENADQLGTATQIETNDRRALNAVWRDNYLWCTTTVMPPAGPNAGQATAHWFKLSTENTNNIVLWEQGDIGGEDIAPGVSTFFPSISVNSTGDMIVDFSASGPTIYPGAYYAYKNSTDPPNTIRQSILLKGGADYYIRTLGGTRNRWGDYTGSSVDPSDEQSFFLFNQYAMTRGSLFNGEDGRWGTAWGSIPASALPVELTDFKASVLNGKCFLTWHTASEVNNWGFEIQRASVQQSLKEKINWNVIGFLKGGGNSNSVHDYKFTDSDLFDGTEFMYRLKQIDNDGKWKFSNDLTVKYNPKNYNLSQNYPNPFNPVTVIQYTIPEPGNVKIYLYDILGRKISMLMDEFKDTGTHMLRFNASDYSAGIYFYKITSGEFSDTKKMVILK